jgi:hypothetical protein
VGSNATFSVAATGTPAPTYQWRFRGTDIPGANASTYAIANAQPGHEGFYAVVVSNAAGTQTSRNALLGIYREYGRAPAPYPSSWASNGARHLVVPEFQLGRTNMPSIDARTNSVGDDGVTFLTALCPGQRASLEIVASATGYLNAWIDYGARGSWADLLDQVFTNTPLAAGTNVLDYIVPAGAAATPATWARFRFSSATNLSFTGEAPSGEVEDYPVPILTAPAPSQFTDIHALESGTMQFSATGGPSQAYVLLATTNLVPPNWQSLTTNSTDPDGWIQFADPTATNYPQRFYRLRNP